MQFIATEACTVENYTITDDMFLEWGFIKEETEERNTTVYIEFADGVQDQIYSIDYNDPVTLRINLNIEALGKLEIIKTDTEGNVINGSVFKVTGPDNYSQDVTLSNGKILIDNLKAGQYSIREVQAPVRIFVRYKYLYSRS